MQYFKEHLSKESDNPKYLFGKLEFTENKFYINGTEVINNRGIIGDDVFILNGQEIPEDLSDANFVIGIKHRNIQNIVGILYVDSKIKYGSIKDKTLFLFKPTNKAYPSFYVPYSSKNGIKNKIYVIIQFKEWNVTNKFPIGTLIEVIGDIGNKEVEFEHLRNYYDIRNNTWKIDNNKRLSDIKIISELQSKKEDYQVFSIDPIGSKDIDDAFHFIQSVEGDFPSCEVGIHIASPVKFFKDNYMDILNRVSTVYAPHRKYNMLPNCYAEEIISLLEGQKRFALSLILKFNNNGLESYEIKETIVMNIKNYDYDNFDKIYKYNKNLNDFVTFSNQFFKNGLLRLASPESNPGDVRLRLPHMVEILELASPDSHKLVENWMVYTNKIIAQYLIDNNSSNLILRKHDAKDLINIESEKDIDNNLKNYLKNKQESSAIYEIINYDTSKDSSQKHSKLGNEYYTHFTSPIRRAVDFFIHMLILNHATSSHSHLVKNEDLEKLLIKINSFTKKCRKFDRNSRRLNFLYEIKEKETNLITYGYIIDISKNRLTVYIPEYNLEEKIIIIPKKFEGIADDKILSYKLYQKLDIKLWIFTSFENIFDKLKIEII